MSLNWHESAYRYIGFFSVIIYLIALFGIINFNPIYLTYLRTISRIYISIILITRFFPWRKYKKPFTKFDREIAFYAGIFLLISTGIIDYIKTFIDYV